MTELLALTGNGTESENNFYTETLQQGAYPLNQHHLDAILAKYPAQSTVLEQINGIFAENKMTVPASLLATFAVVISAYHNQQNGDYDTGAMLKFSFVSTEGNSLVRYETTAQQTTRRAFLVFNMNSKVRKQVESCLNKHGLSMVTLDNCSCCITAVGKAEELENSISFSEDSQRRSLINTLGVKTTEVSEEELSSLKLSDGVHSDDKLIHKELLSIMHELSVIDSKYGVVLPSNTSESTEYLKSIFSSH